MKICTKCGIEKLFSEFSKDINKKDGLRTQCKQCTKEKYLINRETEIERSKTYQKNNREKVLKQKLIHAKKYFFKNHEKIKEYQIFYEQFFEYMNSIHIFKTRDTYEIIFFQSNFRGGT